MKARILWLCMLSGLVTGTFAEQELDPAAVQVPAATAESGSARELLLRMPAGSETGSPRAFDQGAGTGSREAAGSRGMVLTHRPGDPGGNRLPPGPANGQAPRQQAGEASSAPAEQSGSDRSGSGNRPSAASPGRDDRGDDKLPGVFLPPFQAPAAEKAERLDLLPDRIRELPLTPVQLKRLAAGERVPYQVLQFTPDGHLQRKGRVYLLLQIRNPSPQDRKVRRHGVDLRVSGDERWLPLVVDGRLVGNLVVSPMPVVNFDPDSDGIVDLRVGRVGNVESWLVLDRPSSWRFLEQLERTRDACMALRQARQDREEENTMFGGFMGKPSGFDPCRARSGRKGQGITDAGGSLFETSPRCRRLLASGQCPATGDLRGGTRDLPPGTGGVVGNVLEVLWGTGARILGGALFTTMEWGQWLMNERTEYAETHYVSRADASLHSLERDFEEFMDKDYKTLEEAQADGFNPGNIYARRACQHGSDSAVCGGNSEFGERNELPESRRRPRSYWERTQGGHFTPNSSPGFEERLGGPGGDGMQVFCASCRAEAAYKQWLKEVMSDARERCTDPRGQPNPAAVHDLTKGKPGGGSPSGGDPQAGWWGGVGALGKEAECAASPGRSDREAARPPTLDEVTRAATGCTDPTTRPRPEGTGGSGGVRCRLRKGVHGNLPTIGVGLGTVVGLGPCPEEVCQGRPDRL